MVLLLVLQQMVLHVNKCNYWHVAEGTACVTKGDGNYPCVTAVDCTGGYQECYDAVCQCKTGYKVNAAGSCEVDVSLLPYGLGTCGSEAMDYLTIPGATKETTKPDQTYGSKICGSTFNVYGLYQPTVNTAPGDIYTYETPFMINYHTDDGEELGETGNAGFCLYYDQLPCV